MTTAETPEQGLDHRRVIPLTERQAQTLIDLARKRAEADHDLVLYAAAIVAGSDCEGGHVLGVQPAMNGQPALLVLEVV